MSRESLAESFHRYFQVVIADTPELLDHVYRIRYEVYCREFHYEREEDCPGGLEKDDYDQHSIHCLVTHRASNIPAGCVRLVTAPTDNPGVLFPFEKFCGSSLYHAPLHPHRLPRKSLCEISRLAIQATFRRRQGELNSPWGNLKALDFTEHERRTFPLLSIALFLAATAVVDITGRRHGFAMMEPRLARLLQRSGLEFTQVGELVNYHGARAAFHLTIEQALADMKPELREIYDYICQNITADLAYLNPRDLTDTAKKRLATT